MARWTVSLGAITAEALALRLGLSVVAARAKLAAAQRRGLFTRERPLTGYPALFTLTRSGRQVTGIRGTGGCRVSATRARHLIVCAAVAAALEQRYPGHRVSGERELRREEREQGRALASARLFAAQGSRVRLHRPDLVLWPTSHPAAPPVVVEIELTVKAPHRLLEICQAWARCRAVAGVLYLASPEVERALARAVTRAHARERVLVLSLGGFPGT